MGKQEKQETTPDHLLFDNWSKRQRYLASAGSVALLSLFLYSMGELSTGNYDQKVPDPARPLSTITPFMTETASQTPIFRPENGLTTNQTPEPQALKYAPRDTATALPTGSIPNTTAAP